MIQKTLTPPKSHITRLSETLRKPTKIQPHDRDHRTLMKALRRLLSISKPIPSLLFSQRLSLFSSATNPSFSNSFSSSDDGDEEEGSGIYGNKLKFQRPRAITRRRWEENLNLGNSGSFIGTVTHPLRVVNNNGGPFGVHTGLRVRNSPKSESSFWSVKPSVSFLAGFDEIKISLLELQFKVLFLGTYGQLEPVTNF